MDDMGRISVAPRISLTDGHANRLNWVSGEEEPLYFCMQRTD